MKTEVKYDKDNNTISFHIRPDNDSERALTQAMYELRPEIKWSPIDVWYGERGLEFKLIPKVR